MKLSSLITDSSGALSHTRLWANVGYAASTAAFVRLNWAGHADPEVWWAYLGCVACASTASKFLSFKYGRGRTPAEEKEEEKS